MAEIHGKGGEVRLGANTVASIDSWTLTVDAEVADISAYGDKDRRFLNGLRNATASISGSYNYPSTGSTGQDVLQDQFSSTGTIAALALHLITDTGSTAASSVEGWSGDAYFTNISINSDIGDKVSFSGNAQFSGGVHRSTL